MPNLKSQKKRLRQSEKRRLRNKSVRSAVKTKIASLEAAIEKKNKKEAESLLVDVVKSLDKAASKGILHPNQASNKKSRLMRKVSGL